jgi:hypothetical protein
VMAASVFVLGLSPILFIIVLFSLPTIIARFRYADSAYFQDVSAGGRWAMGAAWLGLVVFLGYALVTSQQQLGAGLAQIGH